MAITKGYPHKPASAAVKNVMKGFTDNPLLQPKHKAARKRMSKLRHDFTPMPTADNINQGSEEQNNGN